MQKMLLVGVGVLGSFLVEFLARLPNAPQLIVADVDARRAQFKVNNALLGSLLLGYTPKIEALQLDLSNVEATAEVLDRLKPDLILNSSVLQSWYKLRELPPDLYARLSAASLGAWLPVQMLLIYKLMQAVNQVGAHTPVVNASLADIVHPALARVGLAPTIGAGNVDMIAAGVQNIVADRFAVNPLDVQVYMVGHHVHFTANTDPVVRKAPFLLEIFVDSQRVTGEFDLEQLVAASVALYPTDLDFNAVTASSALKNALAILNDTGLRTHAPGPNGLPGGYPVRLRASQVEVVLPPQISVERAVQINLEAQHSDGIAEIQEDGTVVFEDYSVGIMKDLLGYECKKMHVEETEARANELLDKYRAFAARAR